MQMGWINSFWKTFFSVKVGCERYHDRDLCGNSKGPDEDVQCLLTFACDSCSRVSTDSAVAA